MTLAPIEHGAVELAPAIEPGQNLITWARALGAAHQVASALCQTSFVPRHFAGKPEEAAAALMLGDELGLAPVSALRSIFVIGGTPGMYARTMVALVQSRGHDVWTEAESATKVVVCGRRAGSDKVERSEWTIDRARRAGYTNNKKYETSPEDMLYARAASTVCRRVAADVLSGIPYSVEELELEEKPRTAKVARVRPAPAEPELESPSPAPDVGASVSPVEPGFATPEPTVEASAGEAKPMTKRTRGQLFALFSQKGVPEEQQLPGVNHLTGNEYTSRSQITEDDALAVIDVLKGRPDAVDVTDAEIVPEEPAQ